MYFALFSPCKPPFTDHIQFHILHIFLLISSLIILLPLTNLHQISKCICPNCNMYLSNFFICICPYFSPHFLADHSTSSHRPSPPNFQSWIQFCRRLIAQILEPLRNRERTGEPLLLVQTKLFKLSQKQTKLSQKQTRDSHLSAVESKIGGFKKVLVIHLLIICSAYPRINT